MDLRFAILSVGDRVSRGEMSDAGGDALSDLIQSASWKVIDRAVVPDEVDLISRELVSWADGEKVDIVLTTGGTGLSPRDVTPEATAGIAEKLVPGIAEAIRAQSLETTPYAMISRGLAAIRGATLIINLPGSPSGAVDSARLVIPILEHAVSIMHGGRH